MDPASTENGLESYFYIEDIDNVNSYSWTLTNQPGKTFRKLKNFLFTTIFADDLKPLFQLPDEIDEATKFFLMVGELVPASAKFDNVMLKIAVPRGAVYYNFGCRAKDDEVGWWVRDHEEVQYQLKPPCFADYQQTFATAERDIQSIVELADTFCGRKFLKVANFSVMSKGDLLCDLKDYFKMKGNSPPVFLDGIVTTKQNGDESTNYKIRIGIVGMECHLPPRGVSRANKRTGIWLKGYNGLWFQLKEPSAAYEPLFSALVSSMTPQALQDGFIDRPKNALGDTLNITSFSMVNSAGEVIDCVNSISFEGGRSLLSGWLLTKKDTMAEVQTMPISILVDELFLDCGVTLKQKGSNVVPIAYCRAHDVMIRLGDGDQLDVSPTAIISLINRYNWPNEDEQVWRRINNFYIYSATQGVLPDMKEFSPILMLNEESRHGTIAKAKLLPPSSNSDTSPPLSVMFAPTGYSIDFGSSREDENQGLWVQDQRNVWWKLVPPGHPTFDAHFNVAMNCTDKFLALHHTLKYSKNRKELGITLDDETNTLKIKKSVKEIYLLSNRAFDLAFVRDNLNFVLSNMGNVWNGDQSKVFVKSLHDLVGETDQDWAKEFESLAKKLNVRPPLPPPPPLPPTSKQPSPPSTSWQPPPPAIAPPAPPLVAPPVPPSIRQSSTSSTNSENQPRGIKRSLHRYDEDEEEAFFDMNVSPRASSSSSSKNKNASSSISNKRDRNDRPLPPLRSSSNDGEDGNRIQKKQREESDSEDGDSRSKKKSKDDANGAQQVVKDQRSGRPLTLCNFCNTLPKKKDCKNPNHRHGEYYWNPKWGAVPSAPKDTYNVSRSANRSNLMIQPSLGQSSGGGISPRPGSMNVSPRNRQPQQPSGQLKSGAPASSEDENGGMCRTCGGLRKLPKCGNVKHVDGHHLRNGIRAIMNDIGVEKAKYEQHRRQEDGNGSESTSFFNPTAIRPQTPRERAMSANQSGYQKQFKWPTNCERDTFIPKNPPPKDAPAPHGILRRGGSRYGRVGKGDVDVTKPGHEKQISFRDARFSNTKVATGVVYEPTELDHIPMPVPRDPNSPWGDVDEDEDVPPDMAANI